ncbi:MAG: hypothetical protein CVT48_05845 [Thermoplasmata archaeon HGW-Thermoplasmata-1]|nr:MAG: hypothetical protein CVT48_05845 [Thermoplasmata archaeon HGW-Thermoplasmata-1]
MEIKSTALLISLAICVSGALCGCIGNEESVNFGEDESHEKKYVDEINFTTGGDFWHLWKFNYINSGAGGGIYGNFSETGMNPCHEPYSDLMVIFDENLSIVYDAGLIMSLPALAGFEVNNQSQEIEQPGISETKEKYRYLEGGLNNGTYYLLIVYNNVPCLEMKIDFSPAIELLGETGGTETFAYDYSDFESEVYAEVWPAVTEVHNGKSNFHVNHTFFGFIQGHNHYGKLAWKVISPDGSIVRDVDSEPGYPGYSMIYDKFVFNKSGDWEFNLEMTSVYQGCMFWIAGADVEFI